MTGVAEHGAEVAQRASDVSYEIELDGPAPVAGPPVLVDPQPLPGELVPIVPPHLRTTAGIRKALALHAARHAHQAAFHAVRSPVYLLAALGWAVAGLFKVIGAQARWLWFREQHAMRSQAVTAGDAKAWLLVHEAGWRTRRARGIALLAELAALAAGGTVLAHFARWWWWLIAAAIVLPPLVKAGKPAGRSIVGTAVVTPRFRLLNADVVLRAYWAAGLGHPDKPGQQITFGDRMHRDGDGTSVLVDLPYGLGLHDAVKARPKIASGLDVTESQVYILRDPTSHRRHRLWVADRDPLAVPVGRTPLLACKPADVWKPATLGLDERGQVVTVPLMWNSVMVAALPRQGKTFAARLIALHAALDPFARLHVFDGKGSPDWRKFALVADRYAFGLTPAREGLPAEILLDTLIGIKDDVQRRYARLSELQDRNPAACPEGKLTRDLARDPRFGMPVTVLVIDEVQEYFDLGTDLSKDIAALLVFLVKVAPGAGVSVLFATQKPSGVGTGQVAQSFNAFRDQAAIRFGLRTSSWQVSELCLGAGAYSEGLDTSTLLPEYRGVGILRGAADRSPTVRTYLADGQDAERILTAARALRERAGTLSGMAAGTAPETAARDVLADVLACFAGEPGLHWAVLAERLGRRFPDRWQDATAEGVSAQVRGLGVPSVDVKTGGVGLKGCRRADVESAATGTR